MNQSSQNRYKFNFNSGPNNAPRSLLGRIAAFIIGAGILAVSIFVGAIFLAGLIGIVLIMGIVVMVRIWWLKRTMQRYAREHGDLNTEYTVVEEHRHEIDQQR
jgi:hypothetical protein